MTHTKDLNLMRTFRTGAGGLLLTAATLLLAGCESGIADDLVKVNPRDEIAPGAVQTADGANALYSGAVGLFSVSFSGNNGGTEGFALMSGMATDEWMHSGTFSTRVTYDQRSDDANNGTIGGMLRNLHTARIQALRAQRALLATGSTVAGDARVTESLAMEGFAFLMAGEQFCAGMPFDGLDEGGNLVDGAPLTTAEMFTEAITRFDAAIAGAPGAGNVIRNFATVAKARAMMNLGKSQFNAAAALLANVPDNFQYLAFHSTNGNRNGIFVFNTQNERWSIAHNEGINGLPFRGAGNGTDPSQADPRVPWTRTGGGTDVGFDTSTPQYDLLKYLTFEDEVVVASGTEARLMEAEALLNAGDASGMLAKLNALRAGVTGLAPLTDPGSTTAREDLLFREKAFWLFGEGHRYGDLRRLVRQYSRSQSAVFPNGEFFKGGNYGTDVTFPINVVMEQNTLYKAAQDAGQINVRGCLSDAA